MSFYHVRSSFVSWGKPVWGIVAIVVFIQISTETNAEDLMRENQESPPASYLTNDDQKILNANQDDALETNKRHMGAIAALSGLRENSGLNSMSPDMWKRHLGSLAAVSGIRQNPIFQQTKRYVASVLTRPGFWSRNSRVPGYVGRSDSSEDSEWHDDFKRHVGALAKTNSIPFNRVTKSSDSDTFFDYPVDLTEQINGDDDDFQDEPVAIKSKRFLGSLARVGWFPRQFRGYVGENPYEKRHIGSAARMGWIPLSKMDGFMKSETAEGSGFKRNNPYTRRVKFAAPMLLGRFY